MNLVNWRLIYVFSVILRFYFGLSDSYIHPDEHFQSFEILTSRFFGYSTNFPWEFTSSLPARSYGPLYLFYGPLLSILRVFDLDISPKGIWYLARLQLIVFSWITTDMCLYRILPTKPERIKATFFTLTSYISLVFQSHCFSNSLETPLLLICLYIISDFRFDLEVRDVKVRDSKKLFYLGVLLAVGIFNRITFVGFLIAPSWFLLKYFWRFKSAALITGIGFSLVCVTFIVLDTWEYKGIIPSSTYDLVITPLNNFIYNSNPENLKNHGIHPYYTHALINLPQIFGPLLIVLFYKGKNSYYKTIPFLSFISGLVVLSLVPHQELRFLMPLVPLACCCLDFKRIEGEESENAEIKRRIVMNKNNIEPEKVVSLKSLWANTIMNSWYIFNFSLCILMGLFHQGGVIPVLEYSRQKFVANNEDFVQIWWRTYTPPSWILGSKDCKTVQLKDFNNSIIQRHDDLLIDSMGADSSEIEGLISSLRNANKKAFLVAPIASINCEFNNENLKLVWLYYYHVDLDHLNFKSMDCLTPGLGIYEIL